MNDRYYFENVLSQLKSIAGVMYHGTIEASTPDVRATFNALLFDCLELQNETYKTMSQMGWYQNTKAPLNSIKEATRSITMPASQ